MGLFHYQVFKEVVERQTFLQAAQALHITPSAVSHSVAQFEKEVGFPLFIRHRTGVVLTHDGRELYPFVQGVLNAQVQLQQTADNIKGLNSGLVRIGAFSSVCINWLPNIIREFRKHYPGIEVQIVQGDFNQIINWSLSGEIDLGFSALPVAAPLLVEPLLQDPIYCVTSRDFHPRHQRYVTQEDIGTQRFILQKIDYDRDTKKALDQFQVTPNSLAFSIDDPSILALVESGFGLGILPELALTKMTGDVHTYPFKPDFSRTICLVMNKVQAQAPSTLVMANIVRRYLAQFYGPRYLGQPAKSNHD